MADAANKCLVCTKPTTDRNYFCDRCWKLLPNAYKRRWWGITEYGKKPPPDDLVKDAHTILRPQDGGV